MAPTYLKLAARLGIFALAGAWSRCIRTLFYCYTMVWYPFGIFSDLCRNTKFICPQESHESRSPEDKKSQQRHFLVIIIAEPDCNWNHNCNTTLKLKYEN